LFELAVKVAGIELLMIGVPGVLSILILIEATFELLIDGGVTELAFVPRETALFVGRPFVDNGMVIEGVDDAAQYEIVEAAGEVELVPDTIKIAASTKLAGSAFP